MPLVFVHSVVVMVVLVALLGAAASVAATAWSALVGTRRTPATLGSAGGQARARGGSEILRTDSVLAPLVIGLVVLVLLVGMVDVVLVFLVRATLHAGGAWYGVAEAGVTCAALAPFAVVPAVWMLAPLSVLGGIGTGYANVSFSTLLVRPTPDAERGRVSAAASAAVGGAQGVSLLAGGAVAPALSPRAIYAMAGLLGVAVAVALGVFSAVRAIRIGRPVLPRPEESLTS